MTMRGKRKNHRVGESIDLDFSDAKPENAAGANAMLRNFVRRGASKWGALNKYDTVQNLQTVAANKTFVPNEVGSQAVTMVYFDKGADGTWRFVQLTTDEVQITP